MVGEYLLNYLSIYLFGFLFIISKFQSVLVTVNKSVCLAVIPCSSTAASLWSGSVAYVLKIQSCWKQVIGPGVTWMS